MKKTNECYVFLRIPSIEKRRCVEKTVPTGEAVPWTNTGLAKLGPVAPTAIAKQYCALVDWPLLSIATIQNDWMPFIRKKKY